MLKKTEGVKGCHLRKKVQNKEPHEKLHVSYRSKEVDQIRKEYGLTPLQTIVRSCLKCGAKFDSEGIHNRMCNYCAKMVTRSSKDKTTYIED
jgi:PHP family Zn ribbon phosphoesterase